MPARADFIGWIRAAQCETIIEVYIEDGRIRKTYDGPVELSVDYMVFNVTKDDVKVRMSAIDEDIWPLPSVSKKLSADPKDRIGFTDFLMSGRVVYTDVIKFYYDQTNKMFGTDYQPPK